MLFNHKAENAKDISFNIVRTVRVVRWYLFASLLLCLFFIVLRSGSMLRELLLWPLLIWVLIIW